MNKVHFFLKKPGIETKKDVSTENNNLVQLHQKR